MKQHYHCNAKTNSHMRLSIQKSTLSNQELSIKYGISLPTVIKWRQRDHTHDLSSRLNKIYYALDDITKELIRVVIVLTWMPLDDLTDTIQRVKVSSHDNLKQMGEDLDRFLLYYIFSRRHGSLKRELGVRRPYEAVKNGIISNLKYSNQHLRYSRSMQLL